MEEKTDIRNREDLVQMLNAFYLKAFKDELIGRFFTEVVPLDLDTHIPVIADFWESVVFGARGYRKNVMEVHRHIHHLSAIQKKSIWTGGSNCSPKRSMNCLRGTKPP